MEAGFITLVVVAAIVGILIGVCVEKAKTRKVETQGDIYVYYKKPDEGPSLLLDYGVPISDIVSRDKVLFNVIVIK